VDDPVARLSKSVSTVQEGRLCSDSMMASVRRLKTMQMHLHAVQ
jgi:hypothetical protein